jgi:hypothetical protein
MPPADQLTYPYPVPIVGADGSITVDYLASNPDRITQIVASLISQRYYVDLVFAPAGPIQGGSVLYDQTVPDLFAQRDVRRVEPGDEFPIVTFEGGQPLTAQVEKFGGKFPITDEARRRNSIARVVKAMAQLANTVQRKIQQRALAELDAAIVAAGRTAVGTSWIDYAGIANGARTLTDGPVFDISGIELTNEVEEQGHVYDTAIMNPQEWRALRLVAGGSAEGARALLADSGINNVWVTNRQAAGKIKWLAARQVGELGYEVPLSTESWRDGDGKQQNWFQSFVLPIVYVTDPGAIVETTGHAA